MPTLRMGMRFYDILTNSCAVGNYPGRTVDEIYQARKALVDRRRVVTVTTAAGEQLWSATVHRGSVKALFPGARVVP